MKRFASKELTKASVFVVLAMLIVMHLMGFGPKFLMPNNSLAVPVIIDNAGSKALTNLRVAFTGGELKMAYFPAQCKRTFVIYPPYESGGVSVLFNDPNGSEHRAGAEAYMLQRAEISVDSKYQIHLCAQSI